MKILSILSILLISTCAFAQDIIQTKGGDLTITPILHGTLVLEYQNQTIYVDPYGGAEVFEGMNPPDIILITDIHGDHHNQKTLDALDVSGAKFVVPQVVADKLPKDWASQTVVIGNGETKEVNNIQIEALPMYNLPESEDSRHTKGRGNGYVLTFADKRFYISGDTEDIPEMRALKNIDVAFVCMNMPYTMNVEQAADAVAEFQPRVVYPYHYRGRPDMSDTEQFRKLVNKAAPKVEVRLRIGILSDEFHERLSQ